MTGLDRVPLAAEQPRRLPAPPSAKEFGAVAELARQGSAPAVLRLAAAALADDDEHAGLYLSGKAFEIADDEADVLTQATGLLRSYRQPRAVIELALRRWIPARHGAAAGVDLLSSLLTEQRIDDADAVLHELYLLTGRPKDPTARDWREELRAHEFILDGLRVARSVPVSTTVQTRYFRDLKLPTPLWNLPGLDLPLSDGPRIAVVPLAFHADHPARRAYARGVAPWLAGALRTNTNADVSCHVMANDRGPIHDIHVRHSYEMMLDLTGMAGQNAFLIGGAVLGLGDFPAIDLDIWRPDGQRIRLKQNIIGHSSDGVRRLLPRLAGVCGLSRRPDAPSLPPSPLLRELIPAYADVVSPTLASLGVISADLVDRRRERIDLLFGLIEAHPQECEPRLLAFGLLARLSAAGSVIPSEYQARIEALQPIQRPTSTLVAMTRMMRELLPRPS
jgi:hypothetical protein